MFKKMTAVILALSLIAAIWTVPSEASSFSDVPFYNVDFNSGSFDDIAGGVKGEEAYSGEVQQAEFVQDSTLGRKVLRFHGQSALFYPGFDYSKIRSNFTMEAYVKVSDEQSQWGYIAGTYWNADPKSGVCMAVNSLTEEGDTPYDDIVIGKNKRHSIVRGDGSTCDTISSWDSRTIDNSWTHLVYVHDGVNEYFYENGSLVKSRKVWLASIPSVENDSDKAFRIGGYNRLSEYGTIMDCAYVRVYDSAAGQADVEQLYTQSHANPTPTALSFSNVPFYNADFSRGSFDDIAGGVKGEEAYSGEVQQAEFVQDNTLGRKVLRFHGQSALFYPGFDYSKIRSNFTMEAYVKVSAEQTEWGYIAGTYWNADPKSGVCMAVNCLIEDGATIYDDIVIGKNKRHSIVMGDGSTCDTISSWDSRTIDNSWTHLVYVHDGVNEYFYENGSLIQSGEVWLASIPSVENDSDKAFRIGGYNRLSEYGTIMDCAYVRVYDSAAGQADVEQLYTDRLDGVTPVPTATPTPNPDPTPILKKYFEVDFSTGTERDSTGHFTVDQEVFDQVCTIQKDDELNRNVGVFYGRGGIPYSSNVSLTDFKGVKHVTLEAYVNLHDAQKNMAFLETARSVLHLQQYNDGSDACVGFRAGDWPFKDEDPFEYNDLDKYGVGSPYNRRNAYTEQGHILPSGKWVHLVGTCNGVTNRFYIDGQLVASVVRNSAYIASPVSGTESDRYYDYRIPVLYKLMLGDSLEEDATFKGKIAFSRIYMGSVDDAGAAKLYRAANSGASPEPTEQPTPAPTEAPTSNPKKEASLLIASKPSKCSYEIGEELNLTGMQLFTKVGSVRTPVAVEHCTITGFNSREAGLQKLTVAYETEDAIYSNIFTVRVNEKQPPVRAIGLAVKPAKLIYAYGEALDTTGLSVLVHYSDGTVGYVSEDLEVTGYDANAPGIQRLQITYQGRTSGYSVKVLNS